MCLLQKKRQKMSPPQMFLEPLLVMIKKKTRSHKKRNEKLGKVTEAGDYAFIPSIPNVSTAHETRPGGRFAPPPAHRTGRR